MNPMTIQLALLFGVVVCMIIDLSSETETDGRKLAKPGTKVGYVVLVIGLQETGRVFILSGPGINWLGPVAAFAGFYLLLRAKSQ